MVCLNCGKVTTYRTLRTQDYGGKIAPCHV
jgi:hypothetical protein